MFKGFDTILQHEVAVKVMHSQYAQRTDFRERFLNEARTAAHLDHPGIVQVYDFGQARGLLYLVMDFVAGENLRNVLDHLRAIGQWISFGEALRLVRQVSLALDYAHGKGVLHRDIKPDNIILQPEPSAGLPYTPVITDLGLAKLRDEGPKALDGISMGTPPYMSPEQAMSQPTDARSDVYSLGILLFELVTKQLPFPAKTIAEARRYHTQEPPPQPTSLRPNLPEAVERIILKCLEKKPEARYQTAGQLAAELSAAIQSSPDVIPTARAHRRRTNR